MPETKPEEKYCKCIEQNVIVSAYNDNGACVCLSCSKAQCEETCGAGNNTFCISNLYGTNKGIKKVLKRGWCTECINATLYNETQNKR